VEEGDEAGEGLREGEGLGEGEGLAEGEGLGEGEDVVALLAPGIVPPCDSQPGAVRARQVRLRSRTAAIRFIATSPLVKFSRVSGLSPF